LIGRLTALSFVFVHAGRCVYSAGANGPRGIGVSGPM
jgi:hypothetical protein